MTQRKCDFILTLMLGLQTAIEPDLIWKRERAREKEEARRALAAAQAVSISFACLLSALRGVFGWAIRAAAESLVIRSCGLGPRVWVLGLVGCA